eukprot:scaffold5610_cov157-Amphora_coffeaeformis.AAC.7
MSNKADVAIASEETTAAAANPDREPTPESTTTHTEASPAIENELPLSKKQNQGVTMMMMMMISNKEKQRDSPVEVIKDAGDKELVEEAVPALTPKLSVPENPSALHFAPPKTNYPQQSTTPPEQAFKVQYVEPDNPNYHYQINWGPSRGYPSPQSGFSPVQYYYPQHPPQYAPPPPPPQTSSSGSNHDTPPYYPAHPMGGYPGEYHHQYGYGTLLCLFFGKMIFGRLRHSPTTVANSQRTHFPHLGGYHKYGYGHGYGYGYPHIPTSPTKPKTYPYFPIEKSEIPGKPLAQSPKDTKGNPTRRSIPDSSNKLNVSTSNSDSSFVNVERLKRYTKSTSPTKPAVSEQKERKNSISRQRAQQRKRMIEGIEAKPVELRTAEEQKVLDNFYNHRDRKNGRSKERALEKKEEMERILAKPEAERTKIEAAFLEQALEAKKRKNEGDRLRRERLKNLGAPSFDNPPSLLVGSSPPPSSSPPPKELEEEEKKGEEAIAEQV